MIRNRRMVASLNALQEARKLDGVQLEAAEKQSVSSGSGLMEPYGWGHMDGALPEGGGVAC